MSYDSIIALSTVKAKWQQINYFVHKFLSREMIEEDLGFVLTRLRHDREREIGLNPTLSVWYSLEKIKRRFEENPYYQGEQEWN